MNKAYIISVATATTLGYVAGFTADNITSADTVARAHNKSVVKVLSEAQQTTLEGFINTNFCPELNAEIGAGLCDVTKHVDRAGMHWFEDRNNPSDRDVRFVVEFEVAGTWTPGDPQ